jgi:hypothetical protein
MHEINAAKYHEAITILQQAISMVDGSPRPPQFQAMTADNINASVIGITEFSKAIAPLQVPITGLAGVELIQQLQSGVDKLLFMQCGILMLELSKTLRRELQTRKVFCLDPGRADFYEPNAPLWGADVAKKFPSIAYEVDQLGKCYACDLTTASAFHSIRAMEAGIRAIARCVGIPDPTTGKDRNWSNISRTIKDAIDKRWPASSGRMSGDAQLFDRLHGAISGMQNPYRNETMHLSAVYTAPEALHIFELAKGLMQKIASRMDEDGNPKA